MLMNFPQGWIEMHDVSHEIRQVIPHVNSLEHLRPHSITLSELATHGHPSEAYQVSNPSLWETTLAKLLAIKQADIYCGQNLPLYFSQAGLVDITVKRYMIPHGRWKDLTREEKEMADYIERFVRDVIPICIRKAGENAGPEHALDVQEAIQDVKKYHSKYESEKNFLWMYVVCGRKPQNDKA